MIPSYFLFSTVLFLFPFAIKAKAEEKLKASVSLELEKALDLYHFKSFKIEVQQEIFLNSLKKSIKSSGTLYKKGKMFRLGLKGQPSSLFVFDGDFLWYQADTNEKLVFQFKDHPQIHLLTGFFSGKKFFETFEIQKIKQQNRLSILQLLPKIKIKGLKEIFIKLKSHISEARIIWKDLDSWQKISFSRPVYKAFPDRFFQFPQQGFQVIKGKETADL